MPWDLKRIWSLECGTPETPGELWFGTIPGGLFHSGDGGDSWRLVESMWQHPDRKRWIGAGANYPDIHPILVVTREANVIRLGISCGRVWASFDAGISWECYGEGMHAVFLPPYQSYDPKIQDPHRVVQCGESPHHL